MDLIYTIAITLATLAILVGVHEYGHFWVARRCGVKVLRFSIGFGKRLIVWNDQQGTEYSISVVPLGGYVKMLDEREGEIAPDRARLPDVHDLPDFAPFLARRRRATVRVVLCAYEIPVQDRRVSRSPVHDRIEFIAQTLEGMVVEKSIAEHESVEMEFVEPGLVEQHGGSLLAVGAAG